MLPTIDGNDDSRARISHAYPRPCLDTNPLPSVLSECSGDVLCRAQHRKVSSRVYCPSSSVPSERAATRATGNFKWAGVKGEGKDQR